MQYPPMPISHLTSRKRRRLYINIDSYFVMQNNLRPFSDIQRCHQVTPHPPSSPFKFESSVLACGLNGLLGRGLPF